MLDRKLFRDPHHHVAAQLTEIAAPALRFGARVLTRGPASPPALWRNGVILGNGHIGDVLYRTCSLAQLSDELRDCRWTYVTSKPGAETLAGNPALSEVLPWTDDADRLPAAQLAQLRARRFDVALCSENVAHYRAMFTALRLGIPNRVAFTRKGLSGLATLGIQLDTQVSHALAFRTMVDTVTGTQDESPLRPRIFPSASDRSAAAVEFDRLALTRRSVTVVCSVTTRQTVGPCPPAFFEDVLARAFQLTPDLRVVLAGLNADRKLLESLASRLGERALVSAGTLGILGFGAMLGMCSAFIGTDSGARHLANAAGIPVFFVRNLGTTAVETGSYLATETDIAPPGEYLSATETLRALQSVDRDRVARDLVETATARANDMREGSLP
ncbi:MAG: hypothetical protein M3Z30_04665 [Gemmatimonadota bacterium]|nr:hypothetical protein [Gemmatimonadota bacterium]